MFRKKDEVDAAPVQSDKGTRITSVLSPGIMWKGSLSGSGGVRIEGAFEGDILLQGLLVIGESGRVTCDKLQAQTVIVAGAVRGDITAERLEIRETGRVWGNVVVVAFSSEEGAFLRGQVRMEEKIVLEEAATPLEEIIQSEDEITGDLDAG
jgi:cytoskeletal protein CcmA (bactofilin family)